MANLFNNANTSIDTSKIGFQPSILTPNITGVQQYGTTKNVGDQFKQDTSAPVVTTGNIDTLKSQAQQNQTMNKQSLTDQSKDIDTVATNEDFDNFVKKFKTKENTAKFITAILSALQSTMGGAASVMAGTLKALLNKVNSGNPLSDVDVDNLTTEEKKKLMSLYNTKLVKNKVDPEINNFTIPSEAQQTVTTTTTPAADTTTTTTPVQNIDTSAYDELYDSYKKSINDYTDKANKAVSEYKSTVDTANKDYNDSINENVKKYTDTVSGNTASAKQKISDTLSGTSAEKQKAINQYTGDAGFNRANELAEEQARRQANIQAQQSANAARTAMRNAGQSSNAAAILAGQGVANTYNDTYASTFLDQQGKALETGYQSLQATQELQNQILSTTIDNENKALDVLNNAAQIEMNNLNASQLTQLNAKINEAENVLRQNQDILEQEIEYNGKLITVKQSIDEVARLQAQFEIAMNQYYDEQDAAKKAQLFTDANNIMSAISSLLSLFSTNKNASGNEYTEEGIHLVGESGPELVKLPEGAKVIPNEATEEIIRSKDPKEALKDFEENHHLKDKRDYGWCTCNSISDMSDKLCKYLKKHQKKDWGKLKENGSLEGNICDKMKVLDEVFKR